MDDATFMKVVRGEINPGHLIDRSIMRGDQVMADTASDASDMQANYPFLYGVVNGMRAKRVLELGVHDGTSTMALLKAVKETGGVLVSVDEADVPVAKSLVDKFSLGAYWRLVKGNSHLLLPEMVKAGEMFDVVFVDGDHSLPGAREDVGWAEKLLVKGGVLLTHDNTMMVDEVDNEKPFGERGKPACGFLGQEMILGGTAWSGVFFPFGRGLGIWRRKVDMLDEIDRELNRMRELGWWGSVASAGSVDSVGGSR